MIVHSTLLRTSLEPASSIAERNLKQKCKAVLIKRTFSDPAIGTDRHRVASNHPQVHPLRNFKAVQGPVTLLALVPRIKKVVINAFFEHIFRSLSTQPQQCRIYDLPIRRYIGLAYTFYALNKIILEYRYGVIFICHL